jgi:Leucine-rich repeat (LRR) protein
MGNRIVCCFFFLLLQGVDLQKLILAHNNLEVLREDLRNLSSLVVLNISHNKISSLPAAIGEYAHRPY